jgi:hypothetical protein
VCVCVCNNSLRDQCICGNHKFFPWEYIANISLQKACISRTRSAFLSQPNECTRHSALVPIATGENGLWAKDETKGSTEKRMCSVPLWGTQTPTRGLKRDIRFNCSPNSPHCLVEEDRKVKGSKVNFYIPTLYHHGVETEASLSPNHLLINMFFFF